jgi:hypothetical protein
MWTDKPRPGRVYRDVLGFGVRRRLGIWSGRYAPVRITCGPHAPAGTAAVGGSPALAETPDHRCQPRNTRPKTRAKRPRQTVARVAVTFALLPHRKHSRPEHPLSNPSSAGAPQKGAEEHTPVAPSVIQGLCCRLPLPGPLRVGSGNPVAVARRDLRENRNGPLWRSMTTSQNPNPTSRWPRGAVGGHGDRAKFGCVGGRRLVCCGAWRWPAMR